MSGLAFPKPVREPKPVKTLRRRKATRLRAKAALKRIKQRAKGQMTRMQCVAYVRQRDSHRCRVCGQRVQYLWEPLDNHGEVHEWRYRSAGGPDTEPWNCILLCRGCHQGNRSIHSGHIRIIPIDSDTGMGGPVRVWRKGESEPEELEATA